MADKLNEAIESINKRFGKGSIMPLNQSTASEPVEVITTGNAIIDKLTGIGGVPRGRIVEIYGPESGGKTTLTLQIIAQAQKASGIAVFIDAEHDLDPTYARALGVDIDNLLVSQPDCGEDALEIAQAMLESGKVTVVVVDSVAALVPRSELEGEMGDAQMGLQARLMSQAMRKLRGVVSRTNTCLIFINQIRDKMNVKFGSPETTTGGRALKFYSSMRIDVRRIASKKKGENIIGNEVKVKIAKNKLSAPFKEDVIILEFGKGFINN